MSNEWDMGNWDEDCWDDEAGGNAGGGLKASSFNPRGISHGLRGKSYDGKAVQAGSLASVSFAGRGGSRDPRPVRGL